MRTFGPFLFLEFKRLVSKRNIIIFVSFFAICLWLTQMRLLQYREMAQQKEEFLKMEALKVQSFNNYEQYGGYGIRLFFMPCPLSSLFSNSSKFRELTCRIDVGEKLNISTLFKGDKVFFEKESILDFSGFILIIGSLLSLFYGYEAYMKIGYIKFLSSIYGYFKTFFMTWLARVIILCSFFSIIFLTMVLWLPINKIHLGWVRLTHLFAFLVVMLLVQIFFFTVGTIASNWRKEWTGFVVVLFWLLSVYLFPAFLNKIMEYKAKDIDSYYKAEVTKLDALMDFEKESKKELNEWIDKNKKNLTRQQIIEKGRELSKKFEKGQFKRIMEVEATTERQMKSQANLMQQLYSLYPTTFYFSMGNEISSRGFKNILTFYKRAIDTKKKFIPFINERKYAFPPVPIQSFIDQNENIYTAGCTIPKYSFPGYMFLMGWIFFAWLVSVNSFKKSVFQARDEDIPHLENLEIELEKGTSNVMLTYKIITLSNNLYNVLSGQNNKFKGKIFLRNTDIVKDNQGASFIYFCHPATIPKDLKTKDFVQFIGKSLKLPKERQKNLIREFNLNEVEDKRFKEMLDKDKGTVLLRVGLLFPNRQVYIFHDFLKGMPAKFAKQFQDELLMLKKQNASIIYITNDIIRGRKIGDEIITLEYEKDLLNVI